MTSIEPFPTVKDILTITWYVAAIDEKNDKKVVTGEEEWQVKLFGDEVRKVCRYQREVNIINQAIKVMGGTNFGAQTNNPQAHASNSRAQQDFLGGQLDNAQPPPYSPYGRPQNLPRR